MFFNIFGRFKSLEFRTTFLICIFIASVLTSNMLGGKVSEIVLFGFPVIFSAGLIPFFMTFFILDTINEVHGREKAREVIWLAMLTLVFVAAITLIAVALPYAERSWVKEPAFASVFGSSLRIIFASLVAFLLADLVDAQVFAKLKEKTKGKFLWLRSNASNFAGQVADTFLFMFIAFFEPSQGRDIMFIVQLAMPYLALKVALSLVNTPFVYAGVQWLRGK